jgi:hypothetical protein
MDALAFLRERKRMCNSYKCCVGCPLVESHCIVSSATSDEDFKKMTDVVEQWLNEHPRKTRQSVFLEQWPDAIISDDGLPEVGPCQLRAGLIHGDSVDDCENRGLCTECRREFWMQEVE